jgi:16S rRNA pseudouridine516 synthase
VTQEDVQHFAQGVDIGDKTLTLPAHLTILRAGEQSEIELTIQEGRFHQVKRMFHAVGKEVVYLKRLQMGSIVLDPTLPIGEYRILTEEEMKLLC